jgi:hypothetical protein
MKRMTTASTTCTTSAGMPVLYSTPFRHDDERARRSAECAACCHRGERQAGRGEAGGTCHARVLAEELPVRAELRIADDITDSKEKYDDKHQRPGQLCAGHQGAEACTGSDDCCCRIGLAPVEEDVVGQIAEQKHDDVVAEQRGDHFVDPPPFTHEGEKRGHERAGRGAREESGGQIERRPDRDRCSYDGRGHCPDSDLAFSANVEQPSPEREADTECRHGQRDGQGQDRADLGDTAHSLVVGGVERLKRIDTGENDGHSGDDHDENHGSDGFARRPESSVQQVRSSMSSRRCRFAFGERGGGSRHRRAPVI